MATFSTTYNPDQSGPQGFERSFEDYDQLEESCWHSRNTLAGVNERAELLDPHNAKNREDWRQMYAEFAIDHLLAKIEQLQAIQKANRPDSPAWQQASSELAPLFAEMSKFQAAGFDTNVKGGAK